MSNSWMSVPSQIRTSLSPEFKLFNCAVAACTIMQCYVAQFKNPKIVCCYG